MNVKKTAVKHICDNELYQSQNQTDAEMNEKKIVLLLMRKSIS